MTEPHGGSGDPQPPGQAQPLPPQQPGFGAPQYQQPPPGQYQQGPFNQHPQGPGPFGTGIPPTFGPRAIAVIIDAVIAFALSMPLFALILAAILLGEFVGAALGILLGLVSFVVFLGLVAFWVYIYIVAVGRDGQTPGKRQQGIRIVKVDGQPLGNGGAFIRWLIASLMNNIAGVPLGSLWMLIDSEKRTLYDKVLNLQAITVAKGSVWPLVQRTSKNEIS